MLRSFLKINLLFFFVFLINAFSVVYASGHQQRIQGVPQISLVAVLSFAIKLFFTVAALVALYHLIMGAFKWVSSEGDKEAIDEARNKIQAAVVGLVMIVAILSIAYTLEQFVFRQNICFGISCDIKIPGLLKQGAIKYN